MEVVGGPARRIAPNLVQIVDTLGSPAFTTLPTQLSEFMKVMGDVSRRLGPLAQFAESAGGMFGFRLPGSSRSAQPAPRTHSPATGGSADTDARRVAEARHQDDRTKTTRRRRRRRSRREEDAAKKPRRRSRGEEALTQRPTNGVATTSTGQQAAAHVDRHLVTDRHVGRHEPERDAVLEDRRVVAGCHLADGRAVDDDRTAGPRRAAARRRDADEAAVDAALAFGDERVASGEVALVPRDHPAEPGLQRRDAGSELVTVQRQRGFEAERVAGTEPGGNGAGRARARPRATRPHRPAPRSRRRPHPCSRCRPRRTAVVPPRAMGDPEPTDLGGLRPERRDRAIERPGPGQRSRPGRAWSRVHRSQPARGRCWMRSASRRTRPLLPRSTGATTR